MTPLEELCALLGVQVLDVDRTRAEPATTGVPRQHPAWRPPRPAEWWVSAEMPTARGVRPARTPLGANGAIRNPRKLNRWATRLGRPTAAPPLTAEDGHAVLRLLYAVMESKNPPVPVGGPL